MNSDLHLRLMAPTDLPFADGLRGLAGWNQKIRHWEELLAWEPQGCFVAEWKGTPVGTVTTTRYGAGLAWIGMLLVHPDHRGRGIGKALLQRALDQLSDVSCVKLDATPLGQPLYEKLGFKAEWGLTRWETAGIAARDPRLANDSGNQVPPRHSDAAQTDTSSGNSQADASRITRHKSGTLRSLHRADLPSIAELDSPAFGSSREKMLKLWAENYRAWLVSVSESNPVNGYGLLRDGSRACYLGPLVATALSDGLLLIKALLGRADARPVFWDIPDENVGAVALAQRLGFTPQRHLLRMFLGANDRPGIPSHCFAVADPSIG